MKEAGMIAVREPCAEHACYDCGEAASLSELEFVDDLIEHSPFFCGISENFSHCDGDDTLFHDNIVNCCAGSYAQIVQGMALWDDDGRKKEIGNLIRALRARPPIQARVAINAEHLLASLIAMDSTAAKNFPEEALQEALYRETIDLHRDLDSLAG